ncbi:MAG: efflux RND transporter periplasmic adaptor subunit, partial [Kiritimatiellia bacterium]|nr:efflux RND transporter periplasmic adaptor subunit [Kiritimatiellia bacterium]
KPSEHTAIADEKPVAIRTMVLEGRSLPDVLVLPGRLDPFADVVIAAEKGGRVVETAFDKGDRVKKGDTIVRIDDRLWQAELKRAEIELREALKEKGRWEALKSSGAVSASDFDSIQTRLDLSKISLEQAKVHVSQCNFASPVSGVLEDRYVDVGEYVSEGQAMCRVVDASSLKLLADIPEKDVMALEQGDSVPFTIASLPGLSFTGNVSFVASTASRESNCYRTEMIVDDASRRLKPGMIAELSVTRRIREDTIVVPLVSVVPKRGEHIVFVVNGERAEARMVNLEAIIGREAVLSTGLKPGDKVVVEGQRALHDGALIVVMQE